MVPEATRSKAPLFVTIGAILVVLAFLFGATICYAILVGGPSIVAYFTHPPVKNPELAIKARLPDDMWETAQSAANYFKNQQFTEAADCYQQIINKYPDCLYAWSNMGVARYQQGDFDQAKVALQHAVALSPDDAFSWANLGLVFYQFKQYSDAVHALEKAVALNPGDAPSHNYLGCCYTQVGDAEKAKIEYKRATELNPKFGDAYFNLALAYATAHPPDVEQARANYRQAQDLGISKDPRLEKIILSDTAK